MDDGSLVILSLNRIYASTAADYISNPSWFVNYNFEHVAQQRIFVNVQASPTIKRKYKRARTLETISKRFP
jgi:hypothetical protein